MATENLEIIIGANTQDLQNGLNQASQSVTNFGNAVKANTKPTGDATNALTNLSRVAQDAPYGFMGIANNLNPLLESFQRLSKESGGAGNAIKALVGGLMGPAGIGLALGAISSLIVAFGDDISEFANNLVNAGGATKEMKKAIDGIGTEFTSSVEKVNKVAVAFDLFHKGLLTGEQTLNIYNTSLGKNLGIKNNINEAEQTFKDKTKDYIAAQLQRALADSAAAEAAKLLLEKEKLKLKGPESNLFDYFGAGFGPQSTETVNKVAKNRLATQQKELQDQIDGLLGIQKKAEELANTIANKNGIDINTETTKNIEQEQKKQEKLLKQSNKTKQQIAEERLKQELEIIEAEIAATNKWADNEMKRHNQALALWLKYGEVVKAETGVSKIKDIISDQDKRREKEEEKTPISERKISTQLPASMRKDQDKLEKYNEEILKAKENSIQFAEVVSSTITEGIMTMWDAMAKGENPLKALGDYLGDLVKKFAAAIIQATIFQGIMMLLPGGAAAASAGDGFFGGLKKILGMAEGGIVSRPTLAMVGEGGQSEAVMPLNKLSNMMNSTFNAGAMSGAGGGGNGQFVLKGNDLVLALQRSNYSLNLRRGNGI